MFDCFASAEGGGVIRRVIGGLKYATRVNCPYFIDPVHPNDGIIYMLHLLGKIYIHYIYRNKNKFLFFFKKTFKSLE